MSKAVERTLNYMKSARGRIPARIYFALGVEPLRYRTFGNLPTGGGELDDAHLEKFFSGTYLVTMITAGVVNKFLHAAGTIQTLYTDHYVDNYLKRHGLDSCGIWDYIDTTTLDENLTATTQDSRWAYSACKPWATHKEIARAKESSRHLPLLFHDTDLVLRRPFDKILKLKNADDLPMAFGHAEEVGLTEFYPAFDKVHLSKKFRLLDDGRLLHLPSGRMYSTDLPAVNTCLMYFSDYELAAEWSEIFRDMIMENFLEEYDWISGEQILLACDQRTPLMASERRGLKYLEQVRPFLPISWAGNRFIDIATFKNIRQEWHYYRPDWADPEEEPRAAVYLQEIHHLWNEKRPIELHGAFANFLGLFNLQLLRELCPKVNISWLRLEESLRSFSVLKNYFTLLDTGRTIEDLLEQERAKPVEKRLIDNKLIKNLSAPLIPDM